MRLILNRIRSLNMKSQVTWLVVAFFLGFSTFGFFSYSTIEKIRIGGKQYNEVVTDKDLLADCLPPLLYVVENYLSSQLMYSPDEATRTAAVQRFFEFKKNYETSFEGWQARLPEGELKTCLNGDVKRTAEQIINTIEQNLLPAFKAKDREAATAATNKINALFVEHQTAVNELVAKVTTKMNADQAQGEQMAAGGVWQLLGVGVFVLTVIAGFCYILRRSIASEESKLLDRENEISALARLQSRIEFSPDGTVINANDNFCKTLGYSVAEVIGKSHSLFVDSAIKNSPEYRDLWSKLQRGEFISGEFRRICKNGEVRWLQATYNPIADNTGRITRVVEYALDVTDRKIQDSNYQGQINAISEAQAVIEFSLDGKILTANKNFCSALGYTLAEIQGKHHSMFVEPEYRDSPAYAAFWQQLGAGRFDSGEYKRIGKGGKVIYIQASYNPIFDLNGKPYKVVKYASDTTAIVMEREALKTKVDRILEVVSAAAKGDLTQQIQVSGSDPVGQLGDSLTKFFETLSVSIASIGENATALAGASEELSAVSAQMSANATETASQAQFVSSATDEVNANVSVVATGVEELNSAIREIAKNASDAARVSQQAVTIASDTNRTISKLGDSSMEIGKVVKVITSIAEQTNLLALNATIEAARAGEAGKGFAVVANEVKELAKETARATEDISHKIETIQADTNGAISAIQEICEVINRINDISNTIASAVEEQTATANEMGRNVSEAARGSAEIAQNITSVADATRSTTEGANNSMQAASELSRMAGDLQRLVGQFKYHQSSLRNQSRPVGAPINMSNHSTSGEYSHV